MIGGDSGMRPSICTLFDSTLEYSGDTQGSMIKTIYGWGV